jgi:hypothetical protein
MANLTGNAKNGSWLKLLVNNALKKASNQIDGAFLGILILAYLLQFVAQCQVHARK